MLKTVSSITNAIGALNYKGPWNASTNTPTLASGVGAKGDYYVVSTAGSTVLDGSSIWAVGDWVTFNGTSWQRAQGGAGLVGNTLEVTPVSLRGLRHVQGETGNLGANPVAVTVFNINVPYTITSNGFFGVFEFAATLRTLQGASEASERTAKFTIIVARTGTVTGASNTTSTVVIEESGNAYSAVGSAGDSTSMDLTASVPAASTGDSDDCN